MSREHLLAPVVELAELTGWMVVHQRPARTKDGWRTPIIGDAGFPDVVLARKGEVLFLELKGPNGYPSVDQLRWLQALGPKASCVRPDDWEWIESRLKSWGGAHPMVPSLRWTGGDWEGRLADWAQGRLPARCPIPTGSTPQPRKANK